MRGEGARLLVVLFIAAHHVRWRSNSAYFSCFFVLSRPSRRVMEAVVGLSKFAGVKDPEEHFRELYGVLFADSLFYEGRGVVVRRGVCFCF